MLRKTTLLLPALLLLALAAPGSASADLRACSGGDPANGISLIRVQGVKCATGLAVAKRTNSVKCFLNGVRCTHRFRGRRWTCRLGDEGPSARATCRAGRKIVRYRLG